MTKQIVDEQDVDKKRARTSFADIAQWPNGPLSNLFAHKSKFCHQISKTDIKLPAGGTFISFTDNI